jgi:UDP-N-acetylmuramoylalanine--D-glutamate ligase
VVGLARSGVAAARALKSRGEAVFGVDAGSPAGLEDLDLAGVAYETGTDGVARLEGVATVVKSPGVPREAAVVEEALRRGVAVIGELELGWRLVQAAFIAVTGTNGKTTTTELTAHIFATAGRPVAAVGNVGSPLSSLAERPVAAGLTVVCECSSFQLEDTELFAPECAVHLNLAPDHLDRHGTMANYAAAKQRIFSNQVEGDVAVLNQADPHLAALDPPGEAAVVRYLPAERGSAPVDIWLEGGDLVVDGRVLMASSELQLIGSHNVANAMAAAAGALSLGLPAEAVAEGLRSFTGVAHRLEPVAESGGVRFVNDSKATNVEAAVTALGSFDAGVRLILGGSLKSEEFDPLAPAVRAACSAVYLIGEAAGEIEAALAGLPGAGIPVNRSGDLETAVAAAFDDARPGETVLLSPACASFDQFADFEDRGDRFRRYVGEIVG